MRPVGIQSKKRGLSSHDDAATPNPSVVTARNRPFTRRAGRPTSTAAISPAIPASGRASRRSSPQSFVARAPTVAPTAMKATWHSDTCPAQPVMTTTETTTRVKMKITEILRDVSVSTQCGR